MAEPTPPPAPSPAARPPLLSLDEALARLLGGAAAHRIARTETVGSFDALGRVLAADVRSQLDVPPADNTSMDGYAVRAADVRVVGTVLPVAQRIPAGKVGEALAPGTAARIFTGAQVPPGADAVVMQEQCEAIDLGIVPDRLDATRDALRRAAAEADLILTSGGVSVGEEDHLRPAALAGIETLPRRFAVLPADAAKVKAYIEAHCHDG